jgi:hypothetical protein
MGGSGAAHRSQTKVCWIRERRDATLCQELRQDAWRQWAVDHRERVSNLSGAQFDSVLEYLSTNFDPGRPIPQLPAELLETWTSY